jgi:hypothetical protein
VEKRGASLSPSSFVQELDTRRMISDYAVSRGLILSNPAKEIKRRKLVRAKMVVPSREQFQRLINAMRDEDGTFGTQGKGSDAADLVELLAYSGARLAEGAHVVSYGSGAQSANSWFGEFSLRTRFQLVTQLESLSFRFLAHSFRLRCSDSLCSLCASGPTQKGDRSTAWLSSERQNIAPVRLRAHWNSRVKVPDLADTVRPATESNCIGAISPGGEHLEVNEQSVTRFPPGNKVNSIRSAVLASLRAQSEARTK